MEHNNWLEIEDAIKFYRTTGKYGFLSNLYKCPVKYFARVYPTAEHAYQYGKFKDDKVAEWAMQAPKPHLLCILAHGLFPYDITPFWNERKVQRMREVVFCKFVENKELEQKLLATGDVVLIEASKTDSFWGCGKKGTGQNILGLLLMETREKIKEMN